MIFLKKVFFSLFILLLLTASSFAQAPTTPVENPSRSSFEIGAKFGYDFPLFKTPYKELSYKGGRYIGAHADFHFPSNIGIRLDYSNIITRPDILIPDIIHFRAVPTPTTKYTLNIQRHTIALGPSYLFGFGGSKFSILVAPMAAYSWISGGDVLVESINPGFPPPATETQLINTGFKDNVISAKMDVDFSYAITKKLRANLGIYYLRHFSVNLDNRLGVGNTGGGVLSIVHGENIYDQTPDPYTVSGNPPFIVDQKGEEGCCTSLSSMGVNLGISYRFGKRTKKVKKNKTGCTTCCPDDKHKVVVTVRDDISKKVIPGGDVAIKDMNGNIVATGTTNSYGVVDFGEILHGNYTVTGNVYGIETTVASLLDEEFLPNAVIQKEILYTDIRFILKGKVINKGSQNPEPNVIVTLTNIRGGEVSQDNSNGRGEFAFRLDKRTSYEVVGIKENRLSDIEAVSTIGLTRSTTLFVDLELGVDDFDCGKGTVLDIKYEFDKDKITTASKFELNRLVRYMEDHQVARIELASHTDSRGTKKYNKGLSERRAKSAVSYIISRGIPRSRITAHGYGEELTLNGCDDGIKCTEDEHFINRRTEAKLLCN